jgi:3-isopropylmalate dehydrogenase
VRHASNQSHRICLIAGDGIGPELLREGRRLLEWARDRRGIRLDLWPLDLGADRYLRDGTTLPPELKAEIRDTTSAILLGALGDPRIPDHEHARQILFGFRTGFDLYAQIRPSRALVDRVVPLTGRTRRDVDFVVFREGTEGAYSGIGGQLRRDTPFEIAIEEDVNTRHGVERILRAAFAFALRERRPLCLADKSNALRHGHDLWQRVFAEIRRDYRDVQAEHLYIDALCHELVRDPGRFSVIVTTNLFGDIVSDLCAALAGGLGLCPSASLNPEARVPGLFEPVHGSAPALAGRGIANPLAMLRSAGMLLDFLGHSEEHTEIERACADALAAGECTPDVGGTLDTEAAARAVIQRLT